MNALSHRTSFSRQHIQVQGIVQGVGFRPFAYRLAAHLGLVGFVYNDGDGVTIEVEGDEAQLSVFIDALSAEAPSLARIDSVTTKNIPLGSDKAFLIVSSHSDPRHARHTLVSPDVATCGDCLHELLNPDDRRYRYVFINCTNCGPRFTIIQNTPYDREQTTMRAFPMCEKCAAEYHDPLNRRFHAQPNACPTCGPHVSPLDLQLNKDRPPLDIHGRNGTNGTAQLEADSIKNMAKHLAIGAIVAVKGLGGFHLACDALNPETVARLRQRKRREAKPFALMVADIETARKLCSVSDAEAELLQSHRRPIVLLRQHADCPVASQVAPLYNTLGLMLPYTPLHTLLLRDYAEQVGGDRLPVLVMTSANFSDEPIVYQNDDVHERLSPIADRIFIHNRAIHTRCDDSLTRIVAGGEQVLRRSRGYVPEPIKLKQTFPVPVLAVGGHLKNTFCLGKDQQAFVSHHIGDLENLETLTAFREGIEHFKRLFDIQPQAIAYDLHPDYLATNYAANLDFPHKIGVQHHHAHIASVLAEHDINTKVIGVAADGTGYGTDGTIWGGEIMIADLRGFERVAHLATFALPGGEQAILQPWRVGAVLLQQAYGDAFLGLDIPFVRQLDRDRWHVFAQMIARNLNSPRTSSIGRLFDAVSALLDVRAEVMYEGQAAIELEMLAEPSSEGYPFKISDGMPMQMDVRSTIRAIVEDIQRGVSTAVIAGRFHRTITEMLVAVCDRLRALSGLQAVALSGGVFQNGLLLEQTLALLKARGFETYINRQVPPNDGGLSLGQAAVAAAIIQ